MTFSIAMLFGLVVAEFMFLYNPYSFADSMPLNLQPKYVGMIFLLFKTAIAQNQISSWYSHNFVNFFVSKTSGCKECAGYNTPPTPICTFVYPGCG